MSSKSQVAPGTPKVTMQICIPVAINATGNVVRFTAQTGMTPLSVRCTPFTTFDRTTQDETYVLILNGGAAGSTKLSTDNAAVTTALNAVTIESTFAAGTHVNAGDIIVIAFTCGGTTPIVPAQSLVEFEYTEG